MLLLVELEHAGAPAALFLPVPSHPSYYSQGCSRPLLSSYPSSSLFLLTPSPAGSSCGGGGEQLPSGGLGSEEGAILKHESSAHGDSIDRLQQRQRPNGERGWLHDDLVLINSEIGMEDYYGSLLRMLGYLTVGMLFQNYWLDVQSQVST